MKRAIQTLTVRSINEEKQEISGWATRPAVDRMGDVVSPLGATFAPSIPLLLNHDTSKAVGRVRLGKPTADGIPFTATIAKVSEPGAFQDLCRTAWLSVKSGVIDSVSIGFRVLDEAVERIDTGLKFLKFEIMELSLVAVPAALGATITNYRAANARRGHVVVKLGPFAKPAVGVVKLSPLEMARGRVLADLNARDAEDAAYRKRMGLPKPTRVVRITPEAQLRAEIVDAARAQLEARRRERYSQ